MCVIGCARRSSTYKRGAGDEIRTHDNHVGNVVLYQLSYARAMFLWERHVLCERLFDRNNTPWEMIFGAQLAMAEWHKTTGL
jgi:hypothetical protein